MKHYAIIGRPISHSIAGQWFSKRFRELSIDADFRMIIPAETEMKDFRTWVLDNKFDGLLVTIPLKMDVMRFLDEIDEHLGRRREALVTLDMAGQHQAGRRGQGIEEGEIEVAVSVGHAGQRPLRQQCLDVGDGLRLVGAGGVEEVRDVAALLELRHQNHWQAVVFVLRALEQQQHRLGGERPASGGNSL